MTHQKIKHMEVISETSLFVKFRSDTIFALMSSLAFAALTGLSAFLVIPLPFTPVPITAQTLVVLLSGVFLGRRYGPLSQVIYILLGVIGIPWFANQTSGIEVLLGATGGYLIGFIISSYITGFVFDISQDTRKLPAIIFALASSTVIVYITGVSGLIIVANLDLFTALQLGFFPFLPGDLFKILVAIIVAKFYLPTNDTQIDNSLTKWQKYSLISLTVLASIFLLAFIIYLLSAGNFPPNNLALYSVLVSLIVLPAMLVGRSLNDSSAGINEH